MENPVILEMTDILKRYPGVIALDNVDFKLNRGSIHALMGENGAGKSTLIKVLTGVVKKDNGTILLDGKQVEFNSVHEANQSGISAVYQELDLIPELSISENIFIGREFLKNRLIDWKRTNEEAIKILHSMGIDINVTQKLSNISTAMQQMVSIARAISIESKLVVLDEPTSSLDTSEVNVLFEVIRNLRSKGIAVVFITHRLDEVFEICDEITILKDGKTVHSGKVSEIARLDMVSKMIGRDASVIMGYEKTYLSKDKDNDILLEGKNLYKFPKVINQDIKIKRYEVLGLAGLLGSGRTELAQLLFGVDQHEGGTIEVKDIQISIKNPMDAIKNKIAYLSEDRKVEGIIPNMSVKENITLASLDKISKFGFISKKKQQKLVEQYVKALKIKLADINQPISSLSGGNQQKVILARWLSTNPEILILDEPTRGIDVGAKREILDLVEKLAKDGKGVLMISSILEEIVQTCDLVKVIRNGKTIGELSSEEISESSIMDMIANS